MLLLGDKIELPYSYATCFLPPRFYKLEDKCTSNLLFDFSDVFY